MKSRLFRRYIILTGIASAAGTLLTWPMSEEYTNAFTMAMLVALFMSTSYMVTLRFAWENTPLFVGLILGGVPMRMGIGLALSAFALEFVHQGAYCFGLMAWWVVFTSLEIAMAMEYWHKVGWPGKEKYEWSKATGRIQ